MFVSREELLPRDDTLQEHHEAMLAEAQLVETDKRDKSATGGLFKGVFKNASILGQAARAVLRDLEDGVDRCPMCSWELEDGLCNHCGFDAAGSVDFSDDDGQSISTDYDGHGFGDSETDGDMSLQDFDYDGIDYDFDVHHHIRLPIHRDFHHRLEGEDGTTANSAISVTSDSEGDVTPIYGREDEMHLESDDSDDDSDDSSNSSEMRSFIDDDEGDSEDDDATVRTRSPISGFNTYPGNVTVHYNASVTTSATSEDDDSEEEIVTTSRKAPHRTAPRRQRRVVDSDSEDEDVAESTAREGGDDEEVDQLSELHSTASSSPPRAVRGEFLPLESLTSSPPPRSAASRRARRVSQRARSHRRRA
ncbi:putative ring finger domain-containing protein [Phaeomoniella chlamydospora]|uniref:Putative ring finger domain-containing protein n=1 Tax=Phaeomoniella chlamydospora TaxID=158046 RepID=A0A0G2H109_PHACM|nr:putative ring finger domain-containing protein [Phaeomoniella chlamydospora]